MRNRITFHADIFQEGDVYVALCSELNVSSFGQTIEEAKDSLHEAIEAFIEECEHMGTLEEVMEEAGFTIENGTWKPREAITRELLTIN